MPLQNQISIEKSPKNLTIHHPKLENFHFHPKLSQTRPQTTKQRDEITNYL